MSINQVGVDRSTADGDCEFCLSSPLNNRLPHSLATGSRCSSIAVCGCCECKRGHKQSLVDDSELLACIFAKVECRSCSLDSDQIFTPERIVMQGRRLFTGSPKQHIGKSDKMRDGAINRGAIYLIAGAHRSHFDDGDNHSSIWTFLQPAVKVSQQCLFLITVSHDKTPPAPTR